LRSPERKGTPFRHAISAAREATNLLHFFPSSPKSLP
jgi:hypothetical protein